MGAAAKGVSVHMLTVLMFNGRVQGRTCGLTHQPDCEGGK